MHIVPEPRKGLGLQLRGVAASEREDLVWTPVSVCHKGIRSRDRPASASTWQPITWRNSRTQVCYPAPEAAVPLVWYCNSHDILPDGSDENPNCAFVFKSVAGQTSVGLRALCEINPGSMLTVSYGNKYTAAFRAAARLALSKSLL